jgi:hypothetical protein
MPTIQIEDLQNLLKQNSVGSTQLGPTLSTERLIRRTWCGGRASGEFESPRLKAKGKGKRHCSHSQAAGRYD